MRISDIEEFIVLAQMLNMRRASCELGVPKSSLGRHVEALENVLGVKLFKEGPKLELTRAGVSFLNGAEAIVDSYNCSVRECKRAGRHHADRIVMQYYNESSASFQKVLELVSTFREKYEDACVRFSVLRGMTPLQALSEGTLDVALLSATEDMDQVRSDYGQQGYVAVPLVREPLLLLMNASHDLARQGAIALQDIQRLRIIMPGGTLYNPLYDAVDSLARRCEVRLSYKFVDAESWIDFFFNLNDVDDAYFVTPRFQASGFLGDSRKFAIREIADQRAHITSFLLMKDSSKKEAVCLFKDHAVFAQLRKKADEVRLGASCTMVSSPCGF